MSGWRAPVRKRLIGLTWNRKSQSWSDEWDTHASCSHLRVSGELKTTLNWVFFQLVSRLSGSQLDGRTLKSLKSKVKAQLLIWISQFERVSSLLWTIFLKPMWATVPPLFTCSSSSCASEPAWGPVCLPADEDLGGSSITHLIPQWMLVFRCCATNVTNR